MKKFHTSLLLIWILLLAGNAFSQNYPKGYSRTYQFIENELFTKLNAWSDASLGDVTIMNEAEKESHKNKVQTKRIFLMEHTINYSNTNVKISDEICNASGKKWWSFYTDLVDWDLPFHCEFVSAELKGRHEDGLWYYVTYKVNYTYHKDPSAKKHYTGTMTSDFVKKSLTVHDYMYITCTEYETKLDKVSDKLPEDVGELDINESKPTIVEKPNNNNTPNYLCFTAQEPNSSVGIISDYNNKPDIQYSIDGGKTWEKLTEQNPVELRNIGDKMLIKGNNPNGFSKKLHVRHTQFRMTGKIAASGNIMSLIDGKGESLAIPSLYCFFRLFYDCSSLTSAPELPATKLTRGCYEKMFDGCSSLTSAPELPATKLTLTCYAGMFDGCSSLTSAPGLPATKLTRGCYEKMFKGCTNIKSIKVNFSDWKYDSKDIHYSGGKWSLYGEWENWNPTGDWLSRVAPNGTFYCPRALEKEFDENHIPHGWTVKYID